MAFEVITGNMDYKFNEAELLDEFAKYIDTTYVSHYSSNEFQAAEFVVDSNHGAGFFIGNIMKYAQRYGNKGTEKEARKDLMKILHYALLAIYNHDTQKKKSNEKSKTMYSNSENSNLTKLEKEYLTRQKNTITSPHSVY